MATLTVATPALTGTAVTLASAAGGGDDFVVDSTSAHHFLVIVNGSGGSITVTIDDPNTTTPLGATAFNPDVAVVVGAGTTRYVKIDEPARFMNTTTKKIALTYSGVTSLTVGVFR